MNKELGGILKAWETKFRKTQAAIAKKKRAKSIFCTMSVAHVDDENDPGESGHSEKVFSNGDWYTGQWAGECPHGKGKYLWADGCMYVGAWEKGKAMGRGKFSWPCGATYEGQFKNRFMDGEGTYTGSSNNTYKGSWTMNMRHGRGTKRYANGDYYEGDWRHGLQDGQGRYQWSNGNQYIGHWKSGKMKGNGTMIWANGNRYDGCWANGYPKGNGTYRWVDGSFYVGIWSKDPKEQSGTYYPSSSGGRNFEWDPQEVFTDGLSDCEICQVEKISVYPSEKMTSCPNSDGEPVRKKSLLKSPRANDARPEKVKGRLSEGAPLSCGSEFGIGPDGGNRLLVGGTDIDKGLENLQLGEVDQTRGTQHHIRIQPPKTQGEPICKGHKNYELMLNLQLGIRHAVGRPAPATSIDLKPTAFDAREKIWTKFPREGSKQTPPHQSCEFRWKDYCPLVFRTLRKLFKVDPADYMLSICGNDALRELSSPGKSGSFFYLTNDDRYMIKTMKKSEVKVLKRMLPSYYNHVRAFENTLVTKFYGLHCVKLTGTTQKKVRFVIMGNLFCTNYPIHRRYDLKGSSLGRTTDKPEAQIDPSTTLKDLDLNFTFRLQKVWFQEFCRQVDRDCDFLEQERIMDYSLLVGLHFRDAYSRQHDQTGSPSRILTPAGNRDVNEEGTPQISRADLDLLFDPARLGVNMPARAEHMERRNDYELVGQPTGEYYDVIIVFGIIDILQNYDISKKVEHAYKSFQYDPTSISAVDPKLYSKRFRDFIFRVFTEDT